MRNIGLDLLRLVAILLVLGRHLLPGYERSAFLRVLHTGGWIGVDLFFVLSGFLVSGLLFVEYKKLGSMDIKRFIIRRGFKIYPPLFLLILVTVLVDTLQGSPIKIRQTASELLMMQNYAGSLWNHTWSLAVEWHFYLLLCLFFLFLLRQKGPLENPMRIIPLAFAVCAIFCLSIRVVSSLLIDSDAPQYFKWLYFGTHIRLDSLMFGVLLGYLWHFQGLKIRISRVPFSVLVLVGAVLFAPAFMYQVDEYRFARAVGYSLFYIAAGFWVLAAVKLEYVRGKLLSFLATLGGASYSIYLWHMPMNRYVWPWISELSHLELTHNYPIYLVVYFLGSIALGYALNRLIEKPSLQMREMLFPG